MCEGGHPPPHLFGQYWLNLKSPYFSAPNISKKHLWVCHFLFNNFLVPPSACMAPPLYFYILMPPSPCVVPPLVLYIFSALHFVWYPYFFVTFLVPPPPCVVPPLVVYYLFSALFTLWGAPTCCSLHFSVPFTL